MLALSSAPACRVVSDSLDELPEIELDAGIQFNEALPMLPVLPFPYSDFRSPFLGTARKVKYRKVLRELSPFCTYCGRRLRDKGASLDHVVPLSRGGQNLGANLVLACHYCNGSKSHLTLAEWRTRLLTTIASVERMLAEAIAVKASPVQLATVASSPEPVTSNGGSANAGSNNANPCNATEPESGYHRQQWDAEPSELSDSDTSPEPTPPLSSYKAMRARVDERKAFKALHVSAQADGDPELFELLLAEDDDADVAYVPNPETIAAETAAIRREWSPQTRQSRMLAGRQIVPTADGKKLLARWTPPEVRVRTAR